VDGGGDLPAVDLPRKDVARPDLKRDVAVPDATVPDAPAPDAPAPDLPLPDKAAPDLPLPDKALLDKALPDKGPADMAMSDGGAGCPAFKICSADDWCWWSPVFPDRDYNDVWGSSASDVYLAAGDGSVVKFDGKDAEEPVSGAPAALYGIWGDGKGEVFAVGPGGTVMHGAKGTWTQLATGITMTLYDVWGSSASNVVAVGGATNPKTPLIATFSGSTWKVDKTPSTTGAQIALYSVWGSGPKDIWAVGGGNITHFDGNKWSAVTPPAGGFSDVHGFGLNDVWLLGHSHGLIYLYHYNGAQFATPSCWTKVSMSRPGGLWATGPAEAFVLGGNDKFTAGWVRHVAAKPCTLTQAGTKRFPGAVWASSKSSAYVVGRQGLVMRFDGKSWKEAGHEDLLGRGRGRGGALRRGQVEHHGLGHDQGRRGAVR